MNYLPYYEVIFNGSLLGSFENKKDAIDWCIDNEINRKYIIRKK